MVDSNALIIPVPLTPERLLPAQALALPAAQQRELLREAYWQAYAAGDIKRLYLLVERYGELVNHDCPCCYEWRIETPTQRLTLAARILEPADIKPGDNQPWLEVTEETAPKWRPRVVCSDKVANQQRWLAGHWLQVVAQETQRLEAARQAQTAQEAAERAHQAQMRELAEELALARDLMDA